ncbi:MAG: cytochrome c3 family protein [Adlercreutzia equolifaciens]|uniref:cytochrome c3 family protein n=1 Tax=Adlercreutzia TaxID=447020 RepID=UPI001D0638D3|nr:MULTISPECIES: cytochrome c3 family protein [Adlercreutzia]MCB6760862.1 cytochrome c3 family protein [Adlercreutzia equolifaciens]MCB6976593.1 cytochrome c3 family protein [Adlercreutzia equolifaciens]MCQ5070732.1 cytochrome c3 family protein [Adlercreutzia sp. DFI.6.23]MDE8684862.1 cytochrome c3 family protein [Adlercreutzia rubneri]
MKKNVLILAVAACVLALGFALFACAPQQPSGEADRAAGGATEELIDTAAGEGLYQSDEQCLSCHGGSHEALAATTADYGLSNPHNSIHGGYNSCVNCHARDKEITDNKCDNCHAWPHNPENGPGASL